MRCDPPALRASPAPGRGQRALRLRAQIAGTGRGAKKDKSNVTPAKRHTRAMPPLPRFQHLDNAQQMRRSPRAAAPHAPHRVAPHPYPLAAVQRVRSSPPGAAAPTPRTLRVPLCDIWVVLLHNEVHHLGEDLALKAHAGSGAAGDGVLNGTEEKGRHGEEGGGRGGERDDGGVRGAAAETHGTHGTRSGARPAPAPCEMNRQHTSLVACRFGRPAVLAHSPHNAPSA